MKDTITVTVTKEDIVKSNYYDGQGCGLAKALKRAYPHKEIFVGGWYADIDNTRYFMSDDDSNAIQDAHLEKYNGEPLTIKLGLYIRNWFRRG